ncbi:MAG: hypothetical protein H7X76_04845, partial [Prolixibacteraceae bacterium]|nr:hypothetical protein [Burkholderiales bacterium]
MSNPFSNSLHSTFLRLALVAGVILSTALHARDFRSSDVHPGDYPTVEAVRHMGKLLGEQT